MISPAIRQETLLFFLAVLYGAGLAFFYDLLRGLRMAVPHRSGAVSVEDFLYWIAAGFGTFLLAFSVSDGVLRFYGGVGIALGALFYLETISRWIRKGARAFFGFFYFFVRSMSDFVNKILDKIRKGIEIRKKKRYNKTDKLHGKKKTAEQRGVRNGRKKKNRKKETKQK